MSPSERTRYLPPRNVAVTEVHSNLDQEIVQTTVDKLKLILRQYEYALSKRDDWGIPFGIFATLLVTFPTTTFRDWGLSAATWEAAFALATLLSLAYTIRAWWRRGNVETIERLIQRIQDGEVD